MAGNQFINYYCRQKDWWRNMDNCCINFRHCSAGGHMYLVHMFQRCRIDRCGGISKVARF